MEVQVCASNIVIGITFYGFEEEQKLVQSRLNYSPLSLTQSRGDQANHLELSVLWANQIMTS